jgi:hypothetical protein
MLRSWWWCCVALAGLGLGRHSHSLTLFGLTPGVGASRFGATPTGLLSPLVCSLHVYLVVYYLIHPAQVGLAEAQQIRVAWSPTVH